MKNLTGYRFGKIADIPVVEMPANWTKYKKQAGMIRNAEMANVADALVVLIKNESRGASHMLRVARAKGLRCFVVQK